MRNFAKLTVTVLALSLTACSSSSNTAAGPQGGKSGSGHNVIIGAYIPGGPTLKGSGNLTTTKRTVEQFHAIELKDCGTVKVTVGAPLDLQVMTDDNLADAIDTKVEGGRLIVAVNKDFQTQHSPTITVAVPELSEIVIAGSGDVNVNAVKGDIFNITISGSGSCAAGGKVINEKINISGSGNVDCSRLTADNVTVDLSGAGNCKLASEKSLNAKLSGTGNIEYKGTPQSLTKDITGTGQIKVLTM
ncbi:MAG: DUF2807 domain-containing protein [Cyanobacteria bacterium SZAS TMP-1]|nr:DUF2807 domain-containing protein [Cyanobacteria bacterium SZAS TMP-1]